MLRIVQGVPGSGKSYYAVYYLYKYFCNNDDVYGINLKKDVLLITNIDSLKLNHLSLDDCLNKYPDFFTVKNFEKIQQNFKNRHIILIIDECQKYFPTYFKDKDVLFFFQYHRHLGIDIILLTQSISVVCRSLVVLSETIINASPRSISVAKIFKYNEYLYLQGRLEKVNSFSIPKKSEIFKLYSSFSSDEVAKPKNFILRYSLIILFFAIISVISLIFTFKSFSSKHSKTVVSSLESSSIKNFASQNKIKHKFKSTSFNQKVINKVYKYFIVGKVYYKSKNINRLYLSPVTNPNITFTRSNNILSYCKYSFDYSFLICSKPLISSEQLSFLSFSSSDNSSLSN